MAGQGIEPTDQAPAPPDQETPQVPLGPGVIQAALADMPDSSGVYLMKNAAGRVIYVGKAKRLKARVVSYTRAQDLAGSYGFKTRLMVSQVAAVEFIITGSEKEALLLENTLIKRHRPRYNVDLRDDKTFPYLRLSVKHPFPRLSLVRRPDLKDGARYFGPFDNVGAARHTMRLLQRIFPLRRCSDRMVASRQRVCLDQETGLCQGPCVGLVSPQEYASLVKGVEGFFAGRGQEMADQMEEEMRAASAAENYERAALLRDRMQALRRTLEKQSVSTSADKDTDVAALHLGEAGPVLAVLMVRSGRVVASRTHALKEVAAWSPEEIMAQGLVQLYDQGLTPPPMILVSHMPEDPSIVAEVLAEKSSRRVELHKPQRGDKRALMEMALANAAAPRTDRDQARLEALDRLGRRLGLAGPPARMECVDISHLGGSLTVASLVSFADGEPDKSGYRHYNILGQEGHPDDYASMAQVLARRLAKGDPPDLLVVDGGKGQLNIALAALEDAAPDGRPPLAALAKGRGQGPDKVYLPGRKNPVNFPAGDSGLLMLMRLRDEAHRFAITYHRRLRRKNLTRSILEEVPGVGPAKRKKLLTAFKSLAAVKRAAPEEMVSRAGVDQATAQRVAAFLSALDSANGGI